MFGRILGLALLLYGGYMVIRNSLRAQLQAKYADAAATDPTGAAVDIVARTIWGEARGEGDTGMQAVADVIVNRVANPGWWGTDFISVCLAPSQFSCWNAGDPNATLAASVTADDPAFADALQIASAAVAGTLPDITGGATSYFNPAGGIPSWAASMTETAQIGHHVFYA